MATGEFQRAPGLDYEMDNIESRVLDIGGAAPTNIINANQAWQIDVEWEALGLAVGFFVGTATVDAFVESIGPGVELQLGPVNVPIVAGQVNYNATVPVAALTVPIPAGQTSITVKVTTTITVTDAGGNIVPMAAYVEGPVLQFFA